MATRWFRLIVAWRQKRNGLLSKERSRNRCPCNEAVIKQKTDGEMTNSLSLEKKVKKINQLFARRSRSMLSHSGDTTFSRVIREGWVFSAVCIQTQCAPTAASAVARVSHSVSFCIKLLFVIVANTFLQKRVTIVSVCFEFLLTVKSSVYSHWMNSNGLQGYIVYKYAVLMINRQIQIDTLYKFNLQRQFFQKCISKVMNELWTLNCKPIWTRSP